MFLKKVFRLFLKKKKKKKKKSVLCFPVLGVLLCLFDRSDKSSVVPSAMSEQVFVLEELFVLLLILVKAALSETILAFLETTKWSESLPDSCSPETASWLPLLEPFVSQCRSLLEARSKQRGMVRVSSMEVKKKIFFLMEKSFKCV